MNLTKSSANSKLSSMICGSPLACPMYCHLRGLRSVFGSSLTLERPLLLRALECRSSGLDRIEDEDLDQLKSILPLVLASKTLGGLEVVARSLEHDHLDIPFPERVQPVLTSG